VLDPAVEAFQFDAEFAELGHITSLGFSAGCADREGYLIKRLGVQVLSCLFYSCRFWLTLPGDRRTLRVGVASAPLNRGRKRDLHGSYHQEFSRRRTERAQGAGLRSPRRGGRLAQG